MAAKASGQANDLRADFPAAPYVELEVRKASHGGGDVAARVHVRFEEVLESLRLVRALVMGAPQGELRVDLPQPVPGAFGVGVVHEGRLLAANLSCPLSDTSWACHTERYDNTGPLYTNQLAFREACRRVEPTERPYVNDGPAEAPYRPGVDDLAAFKHRLAAFEIQSFRLLRR